MKCKYASLEQLESEKPARLTVLEASALLGVDFKFLQCALQQSKFPFGFAMKNGRWNYYINTTHFIQYMKGQQVSSL